jgi:hypothetical protein
VDIGCDRQHAFQNDGAVFFCNTAPNSSLHSEIVRDEGFAGQ